MAHYAQITDGIVTNVIVVNNEVVGEYPESDLIGKQFIESIGLTGEWVQTSFNNNFRKQFAALGFAYDSISDEFISPQPFPSWSLDSNNDWKSPIPMPEGNHYWDEQKKEWTPII